MFTANRNIDDLSPEMAKRVRRWLELCGKANINVLITEGRRSLNRQKYLYAFGRFGINKTKAKVTWTMKSNHLKGEAIDFGFIDNGKFHYNGDWDAAYQYAEMCGLKSLFEEKGVDRPHLNFDNDFVEAPEWSRNAIRWAKNNKISNGNRPNDFLTRAEATTLLHRLFNLLK